MVLSEFLLVVAKGWRKYRFAHSLLLLSFLHLSIPKPLHVFLYPFNSIIGCFLFPWQQRIAAGVPLCGPSKTNKQTKQQSLITQGLEDLTPTTVLAFCPSSFFLITICEATGKVSDYQLA